MVRDPIHNEACASCARFRHLDLPSSHGCHRMEFGYLPPGISKAKPHPDSVNRKLELRNDRKLRLREPREVVRKSRISTSRHSATLRHYPSIFP